MQDKLYILIGYALVGLFIALWPQFVPQKRASVPMVLFYSEVWSSPPSLLWKAIGLIAAAIGVILFTNATINPTLILGFGLIALMSSVSGGRVDVLAMFTSFLMLCISATLPFWRFHDGLFNISNLELLSFALIAILFIHLFSRQSSIIRNEKYLIIWFIVYTALAALMSFSMGIVWTNSNTVWHHWGAYIGPAELLLTGATPFRDFPMQYGFGPTALIASACTNGCWDAMYIIAGSTTLVMAMLIAVLALALSRNRWSDRLAVLGICLAACLFWTGCAFSVASPLMTPSVSGLRFLPAVFLTAFLFFSNQIEYSKTKILIAHGLWIIGAIWSPESAFYVTFVWWPYYLFIRRKQGSLATRVNGFANAALKLLLMGAGLVIACYVALYITYNEGPTLYGLLAYAINPPGPLPINPRGTIWYFLSVLIIGVGTLLHLWHRTGDTLSFRRGFLVQLLNYSTFSYFLGRSHDNNLLNLMPFGLLVLLHAISAVEGKILPRAAIVLAATFLSWFPVFGWGEWDRAIRVADKKILTFDLKDIRSLRSPLDAEQAIDFVRQNYGEPVTVIDKYMNLVHSIPSTVWSAIHGPANFTFMPSQRRREFLYRTATSLNRAGWVVIERDHMIEGWLADFDFAYERTKYLEFGTYYAIRYSPKKHD